MPTYIGENKIVDRYVGDKLVVAAYKGESKYFDAYSEITGTLPLIFKSRAAVALKNYRIYGTSEGAGVETENLFDKGSAVDGYWLQASNGAMVVHSGYCVSDYIPIVAGETYFSYSAGRTFCWYDQTKSFIETSPTGISATAPQTASFLRVNLIIANKSIAVLTNFSTAPASYIPYGYKLPLTITSREQSQDYPLYIGSTKLGEEEYVDYEEQKVWKRTANVFNKDADTHYAYMTVSGGIFTTSGQSWSSMIAFAPIIGGNTYSVKIDGTAASQNLQSVFSVDEPANNVSYRIDGKSTYVNHGQAQTFTRTAPTTANWIAIHFYIGLNNPWGNVNITIVNSDDIPSQHIPYIQPTDPPVPLPAISTYQGENTLSSTETVGPVTVKGRINESST